MLPGLEPLRVGTVTLDAGVDPQTYREKLARIVLDGMYQFVGLLDRDGTTLEINRAALDGAGLRLDDIKGKPFWEARWFAVSRESVEAQRDFVRRARDGEFVRCDIEVYGRAAGEETIIVDFSLLPVKDDGGHVVFLLAEGRNVTEKKRAEAEVARKNAELQALLDRVQELDKLKSDLFANVSHELRTPLTLILGPTEEMLEAGEALTERQRRNLSTIHRSAATLLKHVNDLLDLARLDARKMSISYSRVDLSALVRVVAEQFHALAPQRNLSYVVTTPDAIEADIDSDKIERVLLNLLSNAFKFTPAGGRIRCALERADADHVRLLVQDSGPGVPTPLRSVIFERFRQVQEGTTREFGGTGLGLAIARELVQMHGGSIGVTSAPGGGALFQVSLPLRARSGAYVRPAPAPADAARRGDATEGALAELALLESEMPPEHPPEHPPGDRPTVLVVEDNFEMRRFLREALEAEYRVAAVADGRRALDVAIATAPDLVVTDLMLPGLGGDQLVAALRARPDLADIPVLVLTAKQDEALRARLLAESVQDYVTKPFSAHELRARVRNLVAMKRARDILSSEVASQSKDVTELTRHLIAIQHALRESESRWWAIYEHSPVGIAVADPEGRFRTANPAFRRMLDVAADEMNRCTLQAVTPPEDRASTAERIAMLVRGEVREYHIQRRFLRRDEGIAWANTSVSLIPGPSAAAYLLVIVAEDVTERKLAEEALAKAQNELARVARASTLGELAASIAHEVNQPLAAIVANGQACSRWLDAQPPDEREARAAIQRIVRDANRASDVITRIREFLRRGESHRRPVDVEPAIQEVLGHVRAEAQVEGIVLRQRVDERVAPVFADAVQLRQVILNLVMNALESIASARGDERTIEVAAYPEASGVCIEVRDSGIGIDEARADRLFEAFHTTKPGGMGMGLAICRSIIEAHGGRLWARAGERGGAVFRFTLPAVRP